MAGFSVQEFSDRFDVLYNNITSNQAPGLNEYEKSIFLTKAQDEIVKNYFLPQSNLKQVGFDGNQKRQIDFSMLTKVYTANSDTTNPDKYIYTAVSDLTDDNHDQCWARGDEGDNPNAWVYKKATFANPTIPAYLDYYVRDSLYTSPITDPIFDKHAESKSVFLPLDMMFPINEIVEVTRNNNSMNLIVIPLSYDEYIRLMSKPFKRPLKYQAWRLLNSQSTNRADIIVGYNDEITEYTLRYVKKPRPIILANLEGGLTINGESGESECELDPILHEEILQRAVELAKVAWTATGQDNLQAVMEAGKRSE